MSLLFIDGFDRIGVFADCKDIWTTCVDNGSTAISAASTIARNGGKSVFMAVYGSNSPYLQKTVANSGTLCCGVAIKSAGITGTLGIVYFMDGASTIQVGLYPQTDGSFQVLRNGILGTVLGTSTTTNVLDGNWHYVEFKVSFSTTVGTVNVWLDGTNILSLTGQNTSQSGNAYANRLMIGVERNSTGSNNWYYDDLYLVDSNGSVNNDRLGDCRVDNVFFDADGAHTDFTPSSGTQHFPLVCDNTDDTTSYVGSGTTGNIDTYASMGVPGNTGAIKGVQISVKVEDPSGTKSLGTVVRSGGTDYVDTGAVLGATWTTLTSVHETDPSTSAAWTEAGIANAEFGVKVTA